MVLTALFKALAEDSQQLKFALCFAVAVPVVAWLLLARPARKQLGTRKIHRLKTALPVLGDTLQLLGNVDRYQDWMVEICKEFKGEPVKLTSLGRPDFLLVCTPEAYEECLKNKFENFPKGDFQCDNLQGILGNGIFASDHAKWVHQRKTASSLFTARSLRDSMADTVRRHAATLRRMLQKASAAGEKVDLFKLLNRLTIEAFAEIGFGIEMNCLEAKEEHPFQTAFDNAQRDIVMRFLNPKPVWKLMQFFGIGTEGRLQRDVKIIDDIVFDIIGKSLARRDKGEVLDKGKTDLVSLFLDSYDRSPTSKEKPFDPKYLRDMAVNFLIAGRDTTAQAMSWFFYSVSQHPHVVTKIREELAQYLPGLLDGSVDTPSLEEVAQLTYLDAAIKETLRLYPSVPFSTKHVEEDIVLSDGTFVRKDSNLGMPNYALGRMTYIWGDDAEEFKPERFIDPVTGKAIQYPASKFIAFNAGPRHCIGMNLAMMEMKIVLATLLSQLDIQVLEPHKVTYDFSLTLPVRGELLATVQPANKAA